MLHAQNWFNMDSWEPDDSRSDVSRIRV